MDSVSGSQRPSQLEALQQQQQAGKSEQVEKVAAGYNQNNSVSHQTGGELVALPDISDHAPVIPEPDSSTTPTGEELSSMRTQSLASQARAGLVSSFDIIAKSRPDLSTREMQARVGGLSTMLGSISSAPEAQLKSIVETTQALRQGALNLNTFDADKLDQIMTELQTKMEDNSIKYSEIEIKSRGDEAAKRHESNAEKIQESIDKHNEAKAKRKKKGGLFGLKVAIMTIFPPLAVFESVVGMYDATAGKDSGLSMFSRKSALHKGLTEATEANKKFADEIVESGKQTGQVYKDFGEGVGRTFGSEETWNSTGDGILWGIGIDPETGQPRSDVKEQPSITIYTLPTEDTAPVQGSTPTEGTVPTEGIAPTEGTAPADGSTTQIDTDVAATLQGLGLGQEAMSQQELMKLLLQMQKQEESSEELAQAIAALESGDFEGAKEILSNYTADSLDTEGLGEGLTTETTGQQPGPAGQATGQPVRDQPVADNTRHQPELPPSTEADHQPFEDAFGLAGSLSEVASQTAAAQEEQIRQNGLVRRFGAA